jgi:hypothetical protein
VSRLSRQVGGPNVVATPRRAASRADLVHYIAAVRVAIRGRDIQVSATSHTTGPDRRHAAMLTLRPDQGAFAEPVPAEAWARWDEDGGWSMIAHREGLSSVIGKGLDVMPAPVDVAAWIVVLLAHPELTPSYEDREPIGATGRWRRRRSAHC